MRSREEERKMCRVETGESCNRAKLVTRVVAVQLERYGPGREPQGAGTPKSMLVWTAPWLLKYVRR